jgi:3-oxoacyl-[acyl-carrier protein] reductase
LGLTFTLAMDLGPFNINVNAVAPGDINTEMNRLTAEVQGVDFEIYKKEQAAVIPIRRFGQPEDVANVICFLVSEEASFVHGEVIHVFGGPTRSA